MDKLKDKEKQSPVNLEHKAKSNVPKVMSPRTTQLKPKQDKGISTPVPKGGQNTDEDLREGGWQTQRRRLTARKNIRFDDEAPRSREGVREEEQGRPESEARGSKDLDDEESSEDLRPVKLEFSPGVGQRKPSGKPSIAKEHWERRIEEEVNIE